MIPNNDFLNFKNHCIKVINDRWDSIDILPYMLAYFLHPAYRGKVFSLSKNLKNKKIELLTFIIYYSGAGLKSDTWTTLTNYAGKLFWSMSNRNHSNDKVTRMIAQMANFKCGEGHYSTKYSVSSYVKPQIWWSMIGDSDDYLKSLSLKLFSITPHSVASERAFSMLGFLYGKRRQRLSLSTIEMIARIRSFLLSNSSNELNHLREDVSETELQMLIKECGFFDDDEEEEDDFDVIEDYSSNLDIPPSHEVYVLIINNVIDLNNHVFTGEPSGEYNNASDDDEVSEILDEELDFELIDKISAPANM